MSSSAHGKDEDVGSGAAGTGAAADQQQLQHEQQQNHGWAAWVWSLASWPLGWWRHGFRPEIGESEAVHRLRLELEQFGATVPAMFDGSFTEACRAAKADFKFLVVYLHSSDHQDTPTFCSNVLCTELVASFLEENVVFWAGSVRHDSGNRVARAFQVETFPFVAILADTPTTGGLLELARLQPAPLEAETLLALLAQVMESQGPMLVAARAEHEERQQERLLMEEQDFAYQRSLAADRERQEQKRRAEEEAIAAQDAQAAEEAAAAAAAQAAVDAMYSERQRRLQRAADLRASLGVEPDASELGTAVIAVRLADGRRLQRRFRRTDLMQLVYDFVDSELLESPEDEDAVEAEEQLIDLPAFVLVENFPKREHSDRMQSIAAAGLEGGASLHVHEIE